MLLYEYNFIKVLYFKMKKDIFLFAYSLGFI